MKYILITIISLFVLVSCGKDKKDNAYKKVQVNSSKKVQVNSSKNEKTTVKPSVVVVDKNGVANVLITTNDIMKFNIKKFTVKEGQKVKLTLKHTGKLDKRVMGHNVVILNKGVKKLAFASKAAASKDNDYIPEGTTDIIAHTKMIGGGETTTIEFTAPEAGVYEFICSFPGHYAMMKGKFIVE